MSAELFKVIHVTGVFMLIGSLSAMCLHTINGGTRNFAARGLVAMVHGLGAALAFIGGFGLLGVMHLMNPFPVWAMGKLSIWLLFGAMPALIYRQPKRGKMLWTTVFVLAVIAVALVVYKPA